MGITTFRIEAPSENLSAEVTLKVLKKTKDIIMFVPGTTDPGNKDALKFDANQKYWIEKNKEYQDNLRAKVLELKPKFNDLHILDKFFSWSGDNNTAERNLAAEKLCDVLMRTYSDWTNKEVHFHLIGHSHGGNVINQFSELIVNQEMIKNSKVLKANGVTKFPEYWKIKSITYLSTPFFKEKHQLNHGPLYTDCKIINVHNEYDLTQRFVADFSLKNLEHVLTGFDSTVLEKALERINVVIDSNVYAMLGEKMNIMDDTIEGPLIWERTAIVLRNVQLIFGELLDIINKFKIETLVAEKNELIRMFTALHAWAGTTTAVFERNSTNRRGGYNSWDFGDDLNLLVPVRTINELLAIQEGVEDSYILGLLEAIFNENTGITDSIDDTSWDPQKQTGDFDLEHINISKHDDYNSRNRKSAFDVFIQEIEQSMKAKNLKEVLMRLFSQLISVENIDNAIDKINKLEIIVSGEADDELKILRQNILPVYRGLVQRFDRSLIAEQDLPEEEEEQEIDSSEPFTEEAQRLFRVRLEAVDEMNEEAAVNLEEAPPTVGSLPHFVTTSHSLSHTELWPKVEMALTGSFSSGKNPGYKSGK